MKTIVRKPLQMLKPDIKTVRILSLAKTCSEFRRAAVCQCPKGNVPQISFHLFPNPRNCCTKNTVSTDKSVPMRKAIKRTILMCKPDHFTVCYKINPWMDPKKPTDNSKALKQWQRLYDIYENLGFDIHLIDPVPGLPDMVYAANGGFVLDGIAYGAKFQYPERQPEGPVFMDWFHKHGLKVKKPTETNEGEGDILLVGDVILAGTGFRSDSRSHQELGRIYGREVVTLKLVNPNFYHLDTALAVLDPEPVDGVNNIAYLESAFDEPSLEILRERFPDAVIATEEDANWLGLNSYSDGYNVVISSKAESFAKDLKARGYNPIKVDLSELLLGGGGVKCCTLDLHPVGTGTSVARGA